MAPTLSPRTQPSCTAGLGAEATLPAQRSGLPPPQPKQVAPQQACSPGLGQVLSTHLVASGPCQPGKILEGDPGRLSPRQLPANKPVNKAPQQTLGSSASLNLSLLICEMGNKSPSLAALPGGWGEWVISSVAPCTPSSILEGIGSARCHRKGSVFPRKLKMRQASNSE